MKKKKNKFKNYYKDLKAMYVASQYNLVDSYKESRRHGNNPAEALQDWDLPLPANFCHLS